METHAYFSNIRSHISRELKLATSSICVAVAWFTDAKLFDILCDKAKAGLDVQLMVTDDDITRTYGLNYNELEACGGKVFMINTETTGNLMHNKFCVIDEATTITGSYNWSMKAQANHENITITKDSAELAQMFLDEFKRIKVQYHGKDPLRSFDGDIIWKRLTVVDGLIQLDEFDQIAVHISKMEEFELPKEVVLIIETLNKPDYSQASLKIKDYLVRMKSITIFREEDVEQIKWEIKYLEIEIISLENEKASIEKIIADFVHTYTIEFGDLILKILNLKKKKLKKAGNNKRSAEYEAAEKEYNDFKDRYSRVKEEELKDLTNDEQNEIKQKYRKATLLCHPDKFTDEEMKKKAHKIFVELQDAYSKNDLKRVSEILEKLENGIYDIEEKAGSSNRDQLLKRLEYLRQRREFLTNELFKIRSGKTYRDVVAIKNMDGFFKEEKERLENELKNLENEQ